MAVVLLLVALQTAGQPAVGVPAGEVLEAQVKRFVRDLNSEELAAREAAEKGLVGLGPAALDLLPADSDRLPAETRQRLARARAALERALAEAAGRATLVTLEARDLPVSRVFAAVEKNTRIKIVDFRERFGQQVTDTKVTVSLANVPFWRALDEILDQAGLTVYEYGADPGALAVINRPAEEAARSGRASYAGIFRVEGTELVATRSLRQPGLTAMKLSLSISWEPRVSPITIEQPLSAISAVDENGKPLAFDGAQGSADVPVQPGVSAVQMELPLALPERGSRKIASLKGTFTSTVPGRVETFEFDKLVAARQIEQHRAGVTVMLDTVRKNVDVHEVRVIIRYDQAANALESHRGWIFSNEAYLIDNEGKRLEYGGLETTHQDVNAIGIAYKFAPEKGLDQYKFVYKTAAAILKIPVAYELKDIPLP